MAKLRDLANDEFTGKYDLDGYYPPNYGKGDRPFETHDIFHLFSKSRQNESSDYANRPTISSELIADIYEVVMKRLPAITDESEHAASRQTSVLGFGTKELTLDEIKVFNNARKDYLEKLLPGYEAKELPNRLIEYHALRAHWMRDNIEELYGKPFFEMTFYEWGDLDIDRVSRRNVAGKNVSFEDWRKEYFEPWREKSLNSHSLIEDYFIHKVHEKNKNFAHRLSSETSDLSIQFLDNGLPKYPWESEQPGSSAREELKYFDDYARHNRASLGAPDKKVVYVINYPHSLESEQYLCSEKPPYGEDGKFIDGVKSCTAIVVNEASLNPTGVKGLSTVHTNSYTHIHFPMPPDAVNADFARTLKMNVRGWRAQRELTSQAPQNSLQNSPVRRPG